jgi:murein DD-endopeptidase MepM/ murein hydrolase activator NlpD
MNEPAAIATAIEHADVSPMIPDPYLVSAPLRFDFSRNNPDIQNINMMNADSLNTYVRDTLRKAGCTWGMGGYGEDRFFYQSSELFKRGNEYRTVHLGLDIWLPAGTVLRVPIAGRVLTLRNNDHFLDYGPTIILEHHLHDAHFFTLYGHQSRGSLEALSEGQMLAAGEPLATLGDVTENGSWAPHLHVQIIRDLFGNTGDFPGTVAPSEKELYLQNSPDPEVLLARFLAPSA